MPRPKGSKNKKTLLKKRGISKIDESDSIESIDPVIQNEQRHRIALRLFTLEKQVHDSFIKHISQFGDSKLYESYIINEIMNQLVLHKIVLPSVDIERRREYMLAYGRVGLEPGTVIDDDFKIANKLVHKVNSFTQYQYPVLVDPDIKMSIQDVGGVSFLVNECLKLYIIGNIKIDMNEDKIKDWSSKYKYALKRTKDDSNHNA